MDKRQNIEHSTFNIQHPTSKSDGSRSRQYDLEERLLEYACRIVRLTALIPRTCAGNHVAKQLLKSGTSPLPNHGEAQAAESANDFVHKLKICLKELRESCRWLRLIDRLPLVRQAQDATAVRSLIAATQELIRIFYSSLRTAKKTACGSGAIPDR